MSTPFPSEVSAALREDTTSGLTQADLYKRGLSPIDEKEEQKTPAVPFHRTEAVVTGVGEKFGGDDIPIPNWAKDLDGLTRNYLEHRITPPAVSTPTRPAPEAMLTRAELAEYLGGFRRDLLRDVERMIQKAVREATAARGR